MSDNGNVQCDSCRESFGRNKSSSTGYGGYDMELENNPNTLKAVKGFHGIIKKPTYMLVGENGAEDVDVTPLKNHKFNIKGNTKMSKFKVGIVKKLPKNNLQYPKMTDIFDIPQSKKGGMFSMGGNMFDMNNMDKRKPKKQGFSDIFDGFDIPDIGQKSGGFGSKLNFFGMPEERIPRKSTKFYNKVKGKKLDDLGGFGGWGKLDDYSSEFKLGF